MTIDKKQLVLDQIKIILDEKKGKLLSTYINAQEKLTWQCSNNHIFQKNWMLVRRGQWCPECSSRHITTETLHKIANERGGRCLSDCYTKCIDYYIWECSSGHIWEATLNMVKNQFSWCPYCVKYIGECIARQCFEFLFEKQFLKSKPAWLINKNGYQLELDGYCEELLLAFEFNGAHHYYSSIKGSTKSKLKYNYSRVQENDLIKKELCKKMGIILLEIPDTIKNDRIGHIKHFIQEMVINLGFKPTKTLNELVVDLSGLYDNGHFQSLKKIAEDRGGKVISNEYNGTNHKITFECKYGHQWDAIPQIIKKGSWCPRCNGSEIPDINIILSVLNEIKEQENDKLRKKVLLNAIKLIWGQNKKSQMPLDKQPIVF